MGHGHRAFHIHHRLRLRYELNGTMEHVGKLPNMPWATLGISSPPAPWQSLAAAASPGAPGRDHILHRSIPPHRHCLDARAHHQAQPASER
jgi:hypothetical protein